jgi:hypothetical protein
MESPPRVQDDEAPVSSAHRTRTQFLTHLFFILFCLEIGLVLLLLPWTHLWDNNYFFSVTTQWSELWFSFYLRGAISGLGILNLWIGLTEIWHMRRAS